MFFFFFFINVSFYFHFHRSYFFLDFELDSQTGQIPCSNHRIHVLFEHGFYAKQQYKTVRE